jgi:DNA-binding NtrC family response regulator
LRILLVDDQLAALEVMGKILRDHDKALFSDPSQALEAFQTSPFDVIITDQKMAKLTGLELVRQCQAVTDNFIAMIVSGYTDSQDLIEAVNSRLIFRYILKPFTSQQFLQSLGDAIAHLEARRDRKVAETRLREIAGTNYLENNIIGSHPAMIELKQLIKMFAKSEQPVLITGETGTGKELVARALHMLSSRREKPFVAVNCAAISPHILEGELFGYVRGAFTGANQNRRGFFKAADGGTLFLDEITEFPPEFQAKMLRFLQFGTFYPVGARVEETVDVRIVTASNRDMAKAIEKGTFRDDLYHRINFLRIDIPPLRARRMDIDILFKHLLQKRLGRPVTVEFSQRVQEALSSYSYPGNVRELEALAERVTIVTGGNPDLITETLLATCMQGYRQAIEAIEERNPPRRPEEDLYSATLPEQVANLERRVIVAHLDHNKYNVARTARCLDISRQTLINKMREYQITRRQE